MERFKCIICGYIYDPNEGDESQGIAQGTAFEELPDDFVCPICGAGKEDFVLDD
jgi:rubredoxin